MTVSSGFFNSVAGDRKYDAAAIASVFDGIITDGVFVNYGGHLLVTQDTGLNMNVSVASGRAWFNHTWTYNNGLLFLTLDASEAVLNRIDAVILEVDSSDNVRNNSIKILKGTPASNPVNPTLTNTTTKHQYALAYIRVNAGVTGIASNVITNNIGTLSTPFSTGLLESLSIDDLYTLWESQHSQMMIDNGATFNNWFNNLVNQLSGSQVTNLQAQIDTINSVVGEWRLDTSTWAYSSVDGPTGVLSVSADKTTKIQKGMRIKYNQTHALSGYWSFDASSAAQVGTFTPTDTSMSYTAGKFGNAATFNGTTSKIALADSTTLKPTGEFTLGLWFKTNNSGAYKFLFQSQSHNTLWSGIYLAITGTNVLELAIGNNTLSTAAGLTLLNGATTVTDNNWHYVVVTFRNNYAQIYLDGKLEIAGYSLAPAYAATNYVRVGCQNATGTDTNFMNGQIDDLYIINGYALDEKTIYDKYISAAAQGSGSIAVTKMGIVTNVGSYSGGNTLITLYCGTDFSLSNSAITNLHISSAKAPFGFDPSPDKWTILYLDNSDTTYLSPVSLTWITIGSLVLPIGSWDLSYAAEIGCNITTATIGMFGFGLTLSSSTSSETDMSLSTRYGWPFPIVSNMSSLIYAALRKPTPYLAKAKTTLYMLLQPRQAGFNTITKYGAISPAVIRAVSSYL